MADDSDRRCVSCGRKLERAPSGYRDHHCTARHEQARATAHRTTYRAPPRATFAGRLDDGVNLIAMKGDRDVDFYENE